jgi:flagellar biosynthesis/type III secretory pathway chaperone
MTTSTLVHVLRLDETEQAQLDKLLEREEFAKVKSAIETTLTKLKKIDHHNDCILQENITIKNYIGKIMKKKTTPVLEHYESPIKRISPQKLEHVFSATKRIQSEIDTMQCSPERVKIVQL